MKKKVRPTYEITTKPLEEEDDELGRDLQVDVESLDVECAKQSEAFMVWAKRAVKARALADHLEFAAKVIKAELEARVRRSPDEFDLDKVTENAVEATVQKHPDLAKATKRHLRAKARASLLEKAAHAMDGKKKQLENLITLHGQQYFSGPSVPRDLVAAWKDHQERGTGSYRQREAARRARESE